MLLYAFDISQRDLLRLLIEVLLIAATIFSAPKIILNFYYTLKAPNWAKIPCTVYEAHTAFGILPGATNEELFLRYGYQYGDLHIELLQTFRGMIKTYQSIYSYSRESE